ncbi:hypothetical protein AYO44_03445 [Planctomycetaceae bacterium SCGC AG-212-F19]|nr:hypothetical protein AYO44_03445 [Planctomycetaceae bacterium SCGC AG-212-F19]
MPTPCTADDFIALVVQSGLLDQSTLLRYRSALPPDITPVDSPPELAQKLVRDGLLTRFQSEQLLLGTCRRFLIGKYKVLDRLGSGGMAQVYLAEHRQMGHRVAIKVLPPAKAGDPASLERFFREARATAALNHPNIVRAHDIDQDEGLHFLVIEYVEGSSLQELVLRHGPLHPQQVARYLRQAANGLQHAFEAGLVHRDIKPANLLVDVKGTVKILDLGLARFFADDGDNLSQKFNEAVLGTADYLAPEQVDDSHAVDIRADIYSLGGTMYFCLTGSPPFPDGSFTQKLVWHQTRQPRPIRDVRADLPEQLLAVVDRMMAKDPAQRYQTPAEVATAVALVAMDTGEPKTGETAILAADGTRKETGPVTPLPGRDPTKPIRLPRPAAPAPSPRRHWAVVAVILALPGMLVAGLAASVLFLLWPVASSPTTASALVGSTAPTTPSATEPGEPRRILDSILVVHCGQTNQPPPRPSRPGFSCQLIQGHPWDEWTAPAPRTHCWFDIDKLRFQVKVPAGTPVTLRMLFVDGDAHNRRQQLIVQGRTIDEIAEFAEGKELDVPVGGHETATGKIDVVLEKLAGPNAVISQIEVLVPPAGKSK